MRILFSIFIVFLLGFSSVCSSVEPKKVLIIGFSTNKPPYVFEKEKSGLEVEIFREALRSVGHEMDPFFGPMERLKLMLINGELDAISNTNLNEGLKFYNSVPFIKYHNFAIALKKRKLKIKTISDLKNYSIASFQRARDLLGSEFTKMANANPEYHEFAEQKIRNKMLYKERLDVVVADKRIFEYFNTQLETTVHKQPVIYYDIFNVLEYQAAFRSEDMMKKFNKGIADIKKNGLYKKLEDKYNTQ